MGVPVLSPLSSGMGGERICMDFAGIIIDLEPDKQYLLGLESLARVQVRGKSTMCTPLVGHFGMGLRPRLLHSDILSASPSNVTSCLAPISLLSFKE